MNTKSLILSSALTVAVLLVACTSQRHLQTEIRLSSGGAAAQHGIHNKTLRKIMWDLTLAPAARLPEDVNEVKEPKWRRSDAKRILGAMAESANSIPDVLKGVDIADARKAEFQAMVTNLRANTLRLRDDVDQLSPEAIGKRFDELQASCHACHDRFRVLPLIPDAN